MERNQQNERVSTKENESRKTEDTTGAKTLSGVFLTQSDAEEYRTYKKRKKLSEISAAISRSEGSLLGNEDVQRVCERAVRLRQAAVKVPLSKLAQAEFYLSGSGVRTDCVIGGTGETLTKVKTYETKLALKRRAKEITLIVTPSLVDSCRYGELRREIKRVLRTAKKAELKVRVEKVCSPTVFARVARICSELGVKYFSVPYFDGCERLRMDLTNGCKLEISGVENGADFRKAIGAGVGRIVTDRAWEIYSEWLKETDETIVLPSSLPSARQSVQREEGQPTETGKSAEMEICGKTPVVPKPPVAPLLSAGANPETDYRCRLEGTQLKFL